MSDTAVHSVNIIHQAGTPVGAVIDGLRVEREERLLVDIPGIMRFVPTAPYDNHFVYRSKVVGMSTYMCTCGSAAVVIRTNATQGKYGANLMDADAKLMLVCLLHASEGRHTNAS